jgi:tRNA dimethylallyltransferase
MKTKYLISLVGATAVGKTEIAIKVAQYFDTEIISADSRQFYIEMNIGTAKPNWSELQLVKHYFINSHHIAQEYNAGQFEKDALTTLAHIFKNKDIAILTGGSGLYIKAVCEGFDTMPEIEMETRQNLQKELVSEGLATLLEELKQKDEVYYYQVDKANPQRILRALEVIRTTNQSYSSFRNQSTESSQDNKRPFEIIKIGLDRPREELYERIEKRIDVMIEQGLLDEVKSLYPYRHKNAMQTVGYQEIVEFLDGHYDWEEAIRLLKRNSRRYAKRQLTWFRKDNEIKWFHPEELDVIIHYIEDITKRGYPKSP